VKNVCKPQNVRKFSVLSREKNGMVQFREGVGRGKSLKEIKNKIKKKPTFITGEKLGCHLVIQTKSNELEFIDIEQACFKGKLVRNCYKIDDRNDIKFIGAH